MKGMCILALYCGGFYKCHLGKVLFKFFISILIFYVFVLLNVERGVLKSPTEIVDLSSYDFSF